MNREEAIKKLAEIIFDVSELGNIPYDTEDEQCAMNIARRRIDELFPQLPSNLDEAANDYGVNIRKGYPRIMDETDKYIYNAFKAGAEWMAGQMKQEQIEVDLEEEIKKYFQGLWPGIETAEQCNTDMHFTPLAILRMVEYFYELGLKAKK